MKKRIFFFLAAIVVIAVSFATVHASDQSLPGVGQLAPTFTLPSQDGSQISLESFRGKWVVLYFYPKDMTSDFSLPAQDGGTVNLKELRGKWVVLYFYPKDMTSGCTIEAHNFQRDQAKFDAVSAVILGVSVDTPDSHKQFCTKEGLTFRLLADPAHKVVEAYGSLGHFGPMTIANRNTFLIDPQGKIVQVWTKVDPSVHSTEVLAAIHAAQSSTNSPNPSSL